MPPASLTPRRTRIAAALAASLITITAGTAIAADSKPRIASATMRRLAQSEGHQISHTLWRVPLTHGAHAGRHVAGQLVQQGCARGVRLARQIPRL
eukprot:gene11328-15154_t